MESLHQKLVRINSLAPKEVEKSPGLRFTREHTEHGEEGFRDRSERTRANVNMDNAIYEAAKPMHRHPDDPKAQGTEAEKTQTPAELKMGMDRQADPTVVSVHGLGGSFSNRHEQWVKTVWYPRQQEQAATEKVLDQLDQAMTGVKRYNMTMLRDLTRGNDDHER